MRPRACAHAGIGGYSLQTLGLLALGVSISIAVSAPTSAYQPMDSVAPDSPLPKDYDIDSVAAHYERRPLTTLRRGTKVLAAAMRFGIGYLIDSATGLPPTSPHQANHRIMTPGVIVPAVSDQDTQRCDLPSCAQEHDAEFTSSLQHLLS